ncbi:FtsX-like permease family protein [Phenylobacterium sp.]|uniref:FtsX-like permease family protein n=1 Tax=Phenylobacterium sp. TaxID=1871053 RepID=UPI002605C375|nr:FtsX-like permease family protein [Phenylobacterium sp.]
MFRNYLAAALRNLSRNRLYGGVMIAGMAVAFASAILIGLYLRHELTYDRFIPGHERVFLVSQTITAPGKPPFKLDDTSAVVGAELKLRFPEIQYLARYASAGFPSVRRGDVSISERSFVWVDPDFFKVLPLPALAGDPATALDRPDSVVLTRSAARRYFGQDAPLGGQLLVDGHPKRVTAVIEDLPSNSSLVGEFFASSLAPESLLKQLEKAGYSSNGNQTFVRLKPGASAASVDAGFRTFVRDRLQPLYAKINPDDRGTTFVYRLKPLDRIHLEPADGGDPKPGADVKVLIGIGIIGALIVVVAAINFVTLMTARAARRAMEVGVRKALGAGRRDLVLQFMGEAMMYVGVALVLAIALAELLLPPVNAALQRKMAFDYLSNPALLAAMLGVALVTGLLAGVYPAFVLSAFRPAAVLKGGPISAGGRGGRVREILVVAQFAVLVILVLSTATIFRQTVFALKDATHTNKNNILMLYASPCTDTLRDAIRQVPGVKAAACSSPNSVGLNHANDMVRANGHPVMVNYSPVDFGFLELYGVHPVSGRLFQVERAGDDGGRTGGVAPPVVINEAAVRALGYRSPQGAVGKFLTWHFNPTLSINNLDNVGAPYQSSAIIGVIPDITFESVRERVPPTFYYVSPKNDVLTSAALNVKLDPLRQAATVRRIDQLWPKITHGQPVQQYFADLFVLRLYIDNIIQGGFIAVCALIAISIACLGLFALSAFTAERRTKEIGVRKAMGASAADILKLLMWQFTKPVIWANLIAWPVGFLVMRWWLSSFVYRVDQAPWTFAAAGAAGFLIAWATVFAHALNVARAKPVGALRYE